MIKAGIKAAAHKLREIERYTDKADQRRLPARQ
jgi:hypothetical protein